MRPPNLPSLPATATARGAFTLVELLTVLAIISVLAAILLPAITVVRDAARDVKCRGNLRQISLGCVAYASENEGSLPPLCLDIAVNSAAGYNWFTNLLADAGVVEVPAWANRPYGDVRSGIFRCPLAVSGKMQNCGGYGMLEVFGGTSPPAVHKYPTTNKGVALKTSQPPRLVVITDAELGPGAINRGFSNISTTCPICSNWATATLGVGAARHRGRINAVCLDTHVESRLPADLRTDTAAWGH